MKLSSAPVLAAAFLALVAASFGAAAPKAGDILVEKAVAFDAAGAPIEFELGTLYVPENRANPQSRIIAVGFARFRAYQPTGAPATFHLPGGPGDSFLRYMNLTKPEAERKIPARYANDLSLYRRAADMIYVDQRGNSDRGETLRHHYQTQERPLDQPGTLALATAEFVAVSRAAVAEAAAKGIDLAGYSIRRP